MIRYLVDTDISSFFLKRKFPTLQLKMRAAMMAGEVAISVITRAELRYGQNLMEPGDKRFRLIDEFFEEIPILDWTSQAADHYARLAAQQKRTGRPIGTFDTQIAAHALAEGLILVTNNERHHEQVPGLIIENWVTG
ncbi:type II toxin-antitoxin system VapC family toxin [Methylomagnum sp.]